MAKQLGSTGEFFRSRDAWRKHPMLSNQLCHATPGLGIALVAFSIYLFSEAAYNKLTSSSSSSHHLRMKRKIISRFSTYQKKKIKRFFESIFGLAEIWRFNNWPSLWC